MDAAEAQARLDAIGFVRGVDGTRRMSAEDRAWVEEACEVLNTAEHAAARDAAIAARLARAAAAAAPPVKTPYGRKPAPEE